MLGMTHMYYFLKVLFNHRIADKTDSRKPVSRILHTTGYVPGETPSITLAKHGS